MTNTVAKYLLKDVTFSPDEVEDPHIAYTINALGGSASQVSEDRAYLYKSKEGNITLSEDQKKILDEIKKAEAVGMKSLKMNLKEAITSNSSNSNRSCKYCYWIEDFSHNKVIYYADDEYIAVSYEVDSEGNITLGDDFKEVDYQRVPVDEESGEIIKSDSSSSEEEFKSAFKQAYINKDSLSQTDIKNLRKGYEKFFPEGIIPKLLKSSELNTSGAASDEKEDSKVNTVDKNMPSGINVKKEKDSMPDSNVNEDKLENLQKSVDSLEKLLKASEDSRKAAEKRAEEIQKKAEQERLAKAKSDMTDIVKAWDSVDNTEEVVEALLKSSDSKVLLTVMENMHNAVIKAKEDFGETEHGLNGEGETLSNIDKSKKTVTDILKARKKERAKQ